MQATKTIAHELLLSGTILEEQIGLETRAVDDGIKRYRRDIASSVRRGEGANLKPAERLEAHWFEVFSTAIADERDECRKGIPGRDRGVMAPLFELVGPEEIAVIAMHETVGACMKEPHGVLGAAIAHSIGRSVIAEANLKVMAKTDRELLREMDRAFDQRRPEYVNWWMNRRIPDISVRTRIGQSKIGGFALATLIDVASCSDYTDEVFVPAFAHDIRIEKRPGRTVRVGYVRMTNEAFAIIDDGHKHRQTMRPRYLPMIVPPFKWSVDAQGGYVKVRTPYIAKPTPCQKKAIGKARANGSLDQMDDCVDAVGSVGFRVNKQVLAVQRAVWESGGNAIGIPKRDLIPRPPKPSGYDPDAPLGQRWASVDPAVKKAYKQAAAQIIEKNIHGSSAREEYLRKLTVAELMENNPAFYYPAQMDFRGRAYPIPPHLNPQNDDTARGLLEFADGKEVDAESRRELLIEAANCFGVGRLTFEELETWTLDHMREIEHTALDPLGSDWWHPKFDENGKQVGGAEDPWQFLAAVFALTDPTAAAHAPVRRDGTCNGLQHYSAIGRDARGAASVNLIPADRPADIYLQVAKLVQPMVLHDSQFAEGIVRYKVWTKDGHREQREITMRDLAAMVLPFVTRPAVKQPVMTSVYDVTLVGATKQVLGKLAETGLPDEGLYAASQYLARKVMLAIGEVCSAAREIMDWIKTCARKIAKAGHAVCWTTPLGFPVVQPYRRYRSLCVETMLQSFTLRIEEEDVPVYVGGQRRGSSPNFIHSVDATHMFMVARECREESLPFAATHDCFWSLAADCKRVGQINRQQFVRLHSVNLLERLADEWAARYPKVKLPPPPERGDFDLSQVLNSRYFFC